MNLFNSPEISVLMSVHMTDLEVVRRSIDSILNQSYRDFELIVVDDINRADTTKYLAELDTSSHVKVIKNTINIGLTASLITAAKHARGIFLARQDADDESLPERLELQVNFMKSHPDFVLLATSYSMKFSSGKSKSYLIGLDNDQCIQELFLSNPICHSSTIFRKDSYDSCGGYDQRFYTTQDLDLWFRITKLGKVGFLPEVLVKRNLLSSSISMTRLVFLQVYNSTRIRLREIRRCKRRFCFFLIIYSSLRQLLAISILVFSGSRR